MSRLSWCLAATLLLSSAAMAQDSDGSVSRGSGKSGQGWSVVSSQTVGTDNNFIHVQAGYPGLFGSFIHGLSDTFDVGGKFGFIYGSEAGTFIAPGLRAQGLLRFLLAGDDKMKFGLEVEPGIFVQFPAFIGTFFGIAVPVKFTVAFPITSALAVHAGVDLPLLINITTLFSFSIPILLGGGIEYFLNDNFSLNLRMRFGPSIVITSVATGVTFGLDVLAGAAFRI